MSPSKVMKARYRVHRTQARLRKYGDWRSMRVHGLKPLTLLFSSICRGNGEDFLICWDGYSGVEENSRPQGTFEPEGSNRPVLEEACPKESAKTLPDSGRGRPRLLQTIFEPPVHPPAPRA